MRYFPIFFDLRNKRVVVIGGGEEALRKVRLLLKTEAEIAVVAPELHAELAAEPRVVWLAKVFVPAVLDGAALVYSAVGELNAEVSREAQARGIPVNAVDEAEISTFIVPSIVDRDPVVIAIGTEGTAPILGQGIRAKIDAMLPVKLGELAKRANSLRSKVAEVVPFGNRRRSFWHAFFFGAPRDTFLAGDEAGFADSFFDAMAKDAQPAVGRVSLVGAGPGDPELLTLKAQRKIYEADVIVYDRLVSPGVLEMARRDAVRIPVGKTPYKPSPKQSDIHEILIREARAGRIVVRLKGGDPYVFGRGGEEQAALENAGIKVDIVPGITAALGCAAAVKLPLTQRGQNQSFTIITAASRTGQAEQDWSGLARSGSAFAIYMGLNAAGDIARNLMQAGMPAETPVTIIENGTLPHERVLNATIGTLWERIQLSSVISPAIIYVGLRPAITHADSTGFPIREDIRDAIMKAAS